MPHATVYLYFKCETFEEFIVILFESAHLWEVHLLRGLTAGSLILTTFGCLCNYEQIYSSFPETCVTLRGLKVVLPVLPVQMWGYLQLSYF